MTTPRTDPKGPKPTVSQAKAAWEAHADPGLNNVLQALHDAGFTGTVRSTLYRWHKNGWSDIRRGARLKPKQKVATIKKATKKVADDEHKAALEAETADEAEAKAFAETALSVLAETATRESLTAMILMSRRIQRHADMLVRSAPKEAAKLIEALKGPSSNVTLVMPNGVEQPSDPKTVGGTLIEHDATERAMTPLQQSIREFRSQQLKVVR